MVVRRWSARATGDGAAAYARHFVDVVLPHLRAIDGFAGARLLRSDPGDGGLVGLVVDTTWRDRAAIARFAGDDPAAAVVEDEAAAVLAVFDRRVVHLEVVADVRGVDPR